MPRGVLLYGAVEAAVAEGAATAVVLMSHSRHSIASPHSGNTSLPGGRGGSGGGSSDGCGIDVELPPLHCLPTFGKPFFAGR